MTTIKMINQSCISGKKVVILAWMGEEIGLGNAQNEVLYDFEVELGQGQPPPKRLGS